MFIAIITFKNSRYIHSVLKFVNAPNTMIIDMKVAKSLIDELDDLKEEEDDGYDGKELEWMSLEEKQAKEKERRRRKRLFKTLAKPPKEIDYDKEWKLEERRQKVDEFSKSNPDYYKSHYEKKYNIDI